VVKYENSLKILLFSIIAVQIALYFFEILRPSIIYDYIDYLESLKFNWEDGIEHGNDRVGEFRNWNTPYDPLESNPNNDPLISKRNELRKKNKSYIDFIDSNSQFISYFYNSILRIWKVANIILEKYICCNPRLLFNVKCRAKI